MYLSRAFLKQLIARTEREVAFSFSLTCRHMDGLYNNVSMCTTETYLAGIANRTTKAFYAP